MTIRTTKPAHLHYNWGGGVYRTPRGYIKLRSEGHPAAIHRGKYVFEHRLVMERHLGRYLTAEERVHHKNGNTSDNRLKNLQLCANQSEHRKLHGGKCKLCDRKRWCKGHCQLHYERWKKVGFKGEGPPEPRVISPCRLCGKKHFGLGLCHGHYAKWRYAHSKHNITFKQFLSVGAYPRAGYHPLRSKY